MFQYLRSEEDKTSKEYGQMVLRNDPLKILVESSTNYTSMILNKNIQLVAHNCYAPKIK